MNELGTQTNQLQGEDIAGMRAERDYDVVFPEEPDAVTSEHPEEVHPVAEWVRRALGSVWDVVGEIDPFGRQFDLRGTPLFSASGI